RPVHTDAHDDGHRRGGGDQVVDVRLQLAPEQPVHGDGSESEGERPCPRARATHENMFGTFRHRLNDVRQRKLRALAVAASGRADSLSAITLMTPSTRSRLPRTS